MRAYAEDLLKWVGPSVSEKQLQLDWYDSHTDEEFLTTLKTRGNMITMFYPNRCTDILATCDGGLIKLLQDRFKRKVDQMLENHYDKMTGTDYVSKKIQRRFIMSTMNEAIKTISTSNVQSIARRCGALFDLKPSLEEQFNQVKLRGYTVKGTEEKAVGGVFQYRNVFEGINEEKSKKLRNAWSAKEVKRWKSKSKKAAKKKQNKRKLKPKSKVLSKKRKPASVELKTGEVAVDGEDMAIDGGRVLSEEGEADVDGLPLESSSPLRGGQISFANRKNKTMKFLNELNK